MIHFGIWNAEFGIQKFKEMQQPDRNVRPIGFFKIVPFIPRRAGF
jgi:hypothetical protein